MRDIYHQASRYWTQSAKLSSVSVESADCFLAQSWPSSPPPVLHAEAGHRIFSSSEESLSSSHLEPGERIAPRDRSFLSHKKTGPCLCPWNSLRNCECLKMIEVENCRSPLFPYLLLVLKDCCWNYPWRFLRTPPSSDDSYFCCRTPDCECFPLRLFLMELLHLP